MALSKLWLKGQCQGQWHRWQICRRCRWYRWQFATGIVDIGGKFAAGIVDIISSKFATGVNNTRGTGGKICCRCCWYWWQIFHRCCWHRCCTLTCEYLREFSKKFKMILMLLSGAWRKVIHEKNLKQKSRDTVPLNQWICFCTFLKLSIKDIDHWEKRLVESRIVSVPLISLCSTCQREKV